MSIDWVSTSTMPRYMPDGSESLVDVLINHNFSSIANQLLYSTNLWPLLTQIFSHIESLINKFNNHQFYFNSLSSSTEITEIYPISAFLLSFILIYFKNHKYN